MAGCLTGGKPTPREVIRDELGYRLRRSTWNMGYATEGARALISMGFTGLVVQRVFAHTMTVNTASRRVTESAGDGARCRPGGCCYPIAYLGKTDQESRSAC